ncbi:MAG: hypothetical protein JRG69_03390 [Deltaproteobacteria bacterium]|nr:hypothetical protein [Deltaproteobacteria bacterium]
MAERAPSPRKEYYSDWYQANRRRISDKRKAAYQGDPEYKEKVLSQSAEHRERQRSAPRVKVPRHQVPKRYKTGDGGEVVLFSIGFFAMFISRSVQSINDWEKEDEKRGSILPRTPYIQGSRKFRFYTQAMMEAVKEMVGTKRRLYPVDPEMFTKIEAAWLESGVPVKCEDGMEAALKQTKSAK